MSYKAGFILWKSGFLIPVPEEVRDEEERNMKIYKTKLYRVDYKGTHGGGVDHIRGAILLEKYPWIVDEAIVGNIELTKIG